ncbi:MAG: hypothetical protein K2Y09_04290 [Nitrosomonas sp.]|nr:hypothetical protein [Nitrosomonas sp.]
MKAVILTDFIAAELGAAVLRDFPKEMLINSTNEMKHEAHGTQQPRHIK